MKKMATTMSEGGFDGDDDDDDDDKDDDLVADQKRIAAVANAAKSQPSRTRRRSTTFVACRPPVNWKSLPFSAWTQPARHFACLCTRMTTAISCSARTSFG